jgi:hypothetical protein
LESVIDKPNELVFVDGLNYILVAKALVMGRPDCEDSNSDLEFRVPAATQNE